MGKTSRQNTILTLLMIIIMSCSDDKTASHMYDKCICFYIVGDNDLSMQASALMEEISSYCYHTSIEENNKLIIFLDEKLGGSLYESSPQGLQLVREYGPVESTDKETMKEILTQIAALYPSRENGLILWSHGLGWLPTGKSTRSFGSDRGKAMDIWEIENALPMKYDYIIFDACYMGSVEVMTELYLYCDYFLASPSVVPSEGLIDTTAVSILLNKNLVRKNLVDVCQHVKMNYSSLPAKNFALSLLASTPFYHFMLLCRNLLIDKAIVSKSNLYEYTFRNNHVFFDLGSVPIRDFQPCNFITYSLSPPDCDSCLGLSVYVPLSDNLDYNEPYASTKWNKETLWLDKFK